MKTKRIWRFDSYAGENKFFDSLRLAKKYAEKDYGYCWSWSGPWQNEGYAWTRGFGPRKGAVVESAFIYPEKLYIEEGVDHA